MKPPMGNQPSRLNNSKAIIDHPDATRCVKGGASSPLCRSLHTVVSDWKRKKVVRTEYGAPPTPGHQALCPVRSGGARPYSSCSSKSSIRLLQTGQRNRWPRPSFSSPLCQVSCRLKGGLGLARPPGPVLSELRWGRERVTQCHIQRDLKREWSASWPIGMDPVPPSWPRR